MKKLFLCTIFALLFLTVSSARALMIKIDDINPIQPGILAQTQNPFSINVMIQDVTDLGAFQFDIRYNTGVATVSDVVLGDFLGSTGRDTAPLPPDIDNSVGILSFGALSVGGQDGPSGTGILAKITFDIKNLNDSGLNFENVQITDTDGNPLPSDIQNGQITPRYHISATAGSGGSISPSSSDVPVAPGGTQDFSIQPSACYHIADIKADGVSKSALSRYTFANVNENHTIQAYFDINRFVINVCSVTGGSIFPSGNVSVTCGQNQKFTITPDQGYRLREVKADGVSQGRISEYTFPNIISVHTFCAEFYAAPKGDIDGNDSVNLGDAIVGLQILSGIDTTGKTIMPDADVNGDGRIGIEEVVFILQTVAVLR